MSLWQGRIKPLNTVGFSALRWVLLPRPLQGQVVPSLFRSDKSSHCSPSQIKGGVLACTSQVLQVLQYIMSWQEHVKAHTSLTPPAELRGEEFWVSGWVCNWRLNYSPCTGVPSHHLVFSPAAKIAFGTGMQYGPQQSVLVSTCQNNIFLFFFNI